MDPRHGELLDKGPEKGVEDHGPAEAAGNSAVEAAGVLTVE